MTEKQLDENALTSVREWTAQLARPPQPTPAASYLFSHASPDLVYLVGRLYFPRFEALCGCVVMAGRHSAGKIRRALRSHSVDVVEARLNRLSVWDICEVDGTESEDLGLGILQLLRLGWIAALREQYPRVQFVVDVDNSDEAYPALTFYHVGALADEDVQSRDCI